MFMSVEALRHAYLFRPKKPNRRIGQLFQSPSARAQAKSGGTDRKSVAPFQYNPLHDLESLWWVLVYLLFRRPTNIDDDTRERYEEQLRYFDSAFTDELMDRLEMFQDQTKFSEGFTTLHDLMKPVAELLDWTRQNLVIQYFNSEEQDVTQIDHKVGRKVAKSMAKDCKATAKMFRGDADVTLCELRSPPRRNLNPEQPGAATVIVTSLDSRINDSKKRKSEEHGESSRPRKLRIKDLVEEKQSGTQKPQMQEGATQQVKKLAGVSVKGKGKTKEKGKGKGKAKA